MSPCGIAYRTWEDGRVELQGAGFPMYSNASIRERIAKIWADYGSTITKAGEKYQLPPAWIVGIIYIESGGNPKAAAACEPKWCPALWKQGACEAQGGSEKYCAGGLMAFISNTAGIFGKTIDYYVEHPHEMIMDATHLIAVGGPSGRTFRGGVHGNGGDMLSVAKWYNGGSRCAGGGITGHGGQADYVSKFVKSVNAFVDMGLAPAPSIASMGPGLAVAGLALGAVGYMFADIRWGLSDRILDWMRGKL
jgi:hypothetical protein